MLGTVPSPFFKIAAEPNQPATMHRFTTRTVSPLQRLGLWLLGCVLVIVFAVANNGSDFNLTESWSTPEPMPAPSGSVDQETYLTARNLAALAATPPEQQYAVTAMRAADHELDQSFATAIRESATSPIQNAEVAKALQQEAELKQAIRRDKEDVAAVAATNSVETPEDGEQRLRIAEAQLALDQDELENVQQELTRLGGNKQAVVQQAFDQHRSVEGQAASLPKNTATAELESPHSLHSVIGQFRILSSLKERRQAIEKAREKALAGERNLERERAQKSATSSLAPAIDPAGRAARLASIRAMSEQQKSATELDRRIRDLQQVAAVYDSWGQLMRTQAHLLRTALTANFLTILMAFLGIFALSGFAQWLIKRWESSHHHRINHARVVITLILEIMVVTRVAIVIFGMPGNVSTIIGFITAGITVTLRDFLVSFIGWFMLMGKRGIQVGDWVEVDGTQGEVVEITALHTFLLETGNWATSGQYTGRQAVFMNKYAVEKKYFNFTTHEQWMWEELVIPAPASKLISPELLTEIQAEITDLTRHSVVEAEASWRDISVSHGLRFREKTPAVVVRTSAAGLEIVVRYVTKASARFETAVRLRQTVLERLRLGSYSG